MGRKTTQALILVDDLEKRVRDLKRLLSTSNTPRRKSAIKRKKTPSRRISVSVNRRSAKRGGRRSAGRR